MSSDLAGSLHLETVQRHVLIGTFVRLNVIGSDHRICGRFPVSARNLTTFSAAISGRLYPTAIHAGLQIAESDPPDDMLHTAPAHWIDGRLSGQVTLSKAPKKWASWKWWFHLDVSGLSVEVTVATSLQWLQDWAKDRGMLLADCLPVCLLIQVEKGGKRRKI